MVGSASGAVGSASGMVGSASEMVGSDSWAAGSISGTYSWLKKIIFTYHWNYEIGFQQNF